MKILILGTPRSGSTSLIKFIDSHIQLPNYKMMVEPFNVATHIYQTEIKNDDTITYLTKFDNILVKSLFLIGVDEYPTKSFYNIFEYFEWCYSYFDKIIIIDRKDKVAQSESFVINETIFRERGIGWHTPKVYDLEKINKSFLNDMVERYVKSSDVLHKISSSQNIPIFYYEDVFLEHNVNIIKELLGHLKIELILEKFDEFIVSPNKRVRIEKRDIKIL